jgi:hypothetical protein
MGDVHVHGVSSIKFTYDKWEQWLPNGLKNSCSIKHLMPLLSKKQLYEFVRFAADGDAPGRLPRGETNRGPTSGFIARNGIRSSEGSQASPASASKVLDLHGPNGDFAMQQGVDSPDNPGCG